MLRLFLGRVTEATAALFLLSAVVFAASRLTGNPLDLLLGPGATREDYARLNHALGLDRTLGIQYGIFLLNALRGDLGTSFRSGESVVAVLSQHLLASAILAAAAIGLTWLAGIPFGVWAAQHRGTPVDASVKLPSLLGQSMPSFWVGLLLIEVFAVKLGWLPSGTNQGALNVILPAFTLALFGIAGIARLLRSSLLEVLDSEFVTVARAKGMPEVTVIWKHALKNAMFPVVSFAGLYFVNVMTLSMVVEVVFAWPGLGQLTFNAILARDFPVVQGVVLVAGAIAIAVNFVVDVLYAYLDPRVRYA
ncbi:MAG: ABC transporter permease [candidate division NC10 bacterium]|nr:ABC transporter permease [candidate division NC10 bacterium]